MKGRTKLLLLGLAVLLAGGILYLYLVFGHSGAPPLTVRELKAKGSAGEQVRVAGRVVPGSIDWDRVNLTTTFSLTQDGESLQVLYKGDLPDDFKPGASLVVEGKYTPGGVFEARALSKGSSLLCSVCHQ